MSVLGRTGCPASHAAQRFLANQCEGYFLLPNCIESIQIGFMSTPEETKKFYTKLGFTAEDTGGGFFCYQKVVGKQIVRVTCDSELPKSLDTEIEVGLHDESEEPLDVSFLENSRELPRFLKNLE